ncbi:MAG: hypothetical protein N2167_09435 [Flavobacteriales bacterium]|nr:hypothetical protein [Flavobacteriales bacterium]
MRIAHIINPFQPPSSSDLNFAQQVTFETIRKARKEASGIVDIEVCCVTYPEDQQIIPNDFVALPYLQQSVLNKCSFKVPRKLPLIAEILNVAYHRVEADFYIYSNIDISLYPNFYLKLHAYLNQGYDALIINRRRIKPLYHSLDDLDLILQQPGKSHPGFDCFVFHRSLYSKFFLGDVCIGVPFFEISFSQNLFAYSKKLNWLQDIDHTFHIGMEIFKRRQPKEYVAYNREQYYLVINKIFPDLEIQNIPFSDSPILVRFFKWGIHPCFPIRLMLLLQLKAWGIDYRKNLGSI